MECCRNANSESPRLLAGRHGGICGMMVMNDTSSRQLLGELNVDRDQIGEVTKLGAMGGGRKAMG